jgi:hypothetical protein
MSLKARGLRVRDYLAASLDDSSQKLAQLHKPQNINEITRRASAITQLAGSSKIVFGWNEDNAAALVNVGILSSPDSSWTQAPAISVTTETTKQISDSDPKPDP